MKESKPISRRSFLKASALAGAALTAAGVAVRAGYDQTRRDFQPERSQEILDGIQPLQASEKPPNIILILADDIGYGDLGCYNPDAIIRTPNIDRMANEGARLTQFYASASTCSPSRAGLLTGRYPIRTHVTMPYWSTGNLMDQFFSAFGVNNFGVHGIPPDEVLIPEALKRRGYRTGLVGKWHLGDQSPYLPNENGFDYFYGVYIANDEEPYIVYRNQEVAVPAPVDQDQTTQWFTQESLEFIRQNSETPFFLLYAPAYPHVPVHASADFRGRSAGGLYGDAVEEVDWSAGQILELLKELGIDENTLVFFSSDNGPSFEGSPNGFRGRKHNSFEGGYRVPLVARWPGLIPAGFVSDAISMSFDLFPTCLAVAGIPLPQDRIIDGLDLLPILEGQSQSLHDTVYYYKHRALHGVRHGDWKYMRRHMTDNGGYATQFQGPFLFNLALDTQESYDQTESHPDVAIELAHMLDEWDAALDDNLRGWK